MTSSSKVERAAPVFAALGDVTRLELVGRLSNGGPQSIVRLTEQSQVSRQAITKHLQVLEAAGLVRSAPGERARVWEIRPKRLGDARRFLDAISEQWDGALERLRTMVEATDDHDGER